DHLALLDELALEHRDVTPLRDQLLVGLAFRAGEDQALLALGVATEAHGAGDFGQDGRLLRLARFEQVGHARQTAGDVAGLGRLLRDTGNDVADIHFGIVGDADDGARRQGVLRGDVGAGQVEVVAVLVHQPDHRPQIAVGATLLGRLAVLAHHGPAMLAAAARLRIGHHHAGQAGHLVDVAGHGDAVDEVVELQPALHLGDDRVGVRIPGGDHLPGLHRIFVADRDHRAVRDLVALPLAAELVDHGDLAGTGNGNQVAALVADRLDVEQPDRALGLDLHVVDRRRPRRRTTDMEGA